MPNMIFSPVSNFGDQSLLIKRRILGARGFELLKLFHLYSTAEPHKIQQLQDWLQTVGKSQNVQDLEEMLDWKNNKPTSSKGKILEPSLDKYSKVSIISP